MGWQEERDRAIAETLAVIRRLTATAVAAESSVAAVAETPRRRSAQDLQEDMQARLRAFRNEQRFLEIQREVHYQQAMQRIRIATESRA